MIKNTRPYKSIYFFATIFIVASVLLFRLYPTVNSNLYLAFATFLVGLFAIYLYIKQHEDKKRDAANIVLMEIRNAERTVDHMKVGDITSSSSIEILLPTNNWVKYNYLFINNLDTDELDLINNFYNQCSKIDHSLAQLSISKQLEEKGSHIQGALVHIAKDAISQADFDNKKKNFLTIIENDGYAFKPVAPLNTIMSALNSLAKVTTSTAGAELKRLAKTV